ncbi:MAG: inverse autotransporter beta domain-containing protein, partial [Hyphomicrobiales bacterium]|nr:inverse autotransporter beta domain-containing protein [Hyphomicrobiales bacterium]
MRSVSFVSWRVFRRSVLLPVGAFLLLSIAGLSSSSEADEPLFARSAQQLERLWGSVLGCAHPGDGEPRSTFETTLDGGNASSAIDHDYVECGKRALRNTSSRMLVDTIEDTLRQGGVALFDERFRLSSGIGWVWGESVTGEFDALIPLLDNEHSNGTGQALFLQPGAIFWPGLEGENRIDANLGLVYRRHFTPDIVVGGSAFYDYDFKQGGQRVGLGLDLQSGILHTALNYYHPLDDWQEGRAGYVEQPLQGADFRLGVTWSRFQLDTSVGIWRFEGDEEEKTKWRPAFGVEAGYQILPGVFLQGGYERHDSDDSLDSRWNAGLAFRFSLPGFEGSEGSNGRVVQPNLWELFEREKRVLYEERRVLQIPMSSQSQVIREPRDSGNMPTTTKVIGVISGRELREDETIEVVVYESTTAQYGQASDNDFTFSQGVYGVDTQTGGYVTLMGSSACAASPCRMDAPANSKAKSIEIEVSALDDSVEKEIPEFIDIRIDIRDGSGNLVHSSDVVRVTIQGHGNTIAFSSDTGSIAEENETSFNITLHIDEPLPAGTDASVTLARSGTATDDDYTLSPARGNNGTLIDDVWTLPTETETATLQITAVDDSDDDDSGPERASFTLTNLTGATGWSLGSATIQHVDITEEDAGAPRTGSAFIWGDIDTPDGDFGDTIRILDMNTVKFTTADSTVADEGEMVTISGELEALSLPVPLNLMVDNASSADLGDDFRYGHKVYELDAATGQQSAPASATNCPAATCEMLIPAGVTRFDVDVDILADATLKEIPEEIVLRVDVPEEHRSIIRGNETTVIIRAHGNTVGFASSSADELMENSGTAGVTVDVDLPSPTSITLNVAATDDAATVMIDRDYTISTRSLLIPANASSASLTLQGINNERSEGDKTITLTLSGNLPRGWSLPSGDATHEITLRDDDLGIGFTSSNTTRVEENVGNVVLSVAPNRTLTGAATIAWSVTAGSDELTSATATSGTLSFQTGDDGDDPQTIPLAVLDDNNAEDAEEVTVTLTATTLPSGWNISRNTHTFTIEPSDGTITFTETGTITAREGERINIGITSTADGPRGGYPLTISIPDGSNGSNDITFPATVTLPEGQKAQNFSITIRRDNTPENEETFTMSLGSGASAPAGWTASSSRTIIIPANENTVTFGPPSSVTISSGESATITASINLAIPASTPSSQRNITITPSGNAVANTDYQLSVSSSLHGNLVNNNNSWTWTLPEGADSGGSTRDIDLTITAMGTNHRNLALDFGGTLLPGWNVTPASRSITLTPATGIPDVRTIGFASDASTVSEGS